MRRRRAARHAVLLVGEGKQSVHFPATSSPCALVVEVDRLGIV